MRYTLAGAVALAFGLCAHPGHAQEAKWSPAKSAGANGTLGVSLGRPVAASSSAAAPSAITLDRPVSYSVDNQAPDSLIRPTSYSALQDAPVYRAKGPEEARPMPSTQAPKEPAALKVNTSASAPKIDTDTPKEDETIVTTFRRKLRAMVGDSSPIITQGDCADDCGGADGICGDCCDLCNTPCLPCSRYWFRGEYLLWGLKHGDAPALVSTGPPGSLGVLGKGASELFGGPLNYEDMSGGRFTLGMWLPCCPEWGIEGSYFFLGQRAIDFADASNGTPLLARPFFNVNRGAEDAELVANPAIPGMANVIPLTGNIAVHSTTRLMGAEANAIRILNKDCCCWWLGKWDFLFGFRYLNLKEDLSIDENLVVPSTATAGLAGATFQVGDQFATRNNFYGGQVGFKTMWSWRCWDLEVLSKVALGSMNESVNIAGFSSITPPGGATSTFNGGLLAQGTNIGHYNRDKFAVVPEVGVTVAYNVKPWMRLLVGYNFLYASNVARPGDQIDRGINTTQLPQGTSPGTLVGAARPAFTFRDSEFWAQGVTFGLEFRY